ncbi:MAG: hypothetical protein GF388_01615 [Candidatus Aegiribacteria sp.]|nr:hypothetical protein [Candidatus Aegiribacteria sp.]MBD3294071.1 hypothetical protein [Candidatus Fermentibacteria bacterium]
MIKTLYSMVMDFVLEHKFWIGGASLAMFLASVVLVPVFIQILPADYFRKEKIRTKPSWVPMPLHILYLVLKNVVGIVLIILGLAMLVLPGQGLLTLIVGVILTDIPGERQAFLFICRKTPVLKAMNWLRKKKGKEPFVLPEKA